MQENQCQGSLSVVLLSCTKRTSTTTHVAVCQNLVPLVNIKIAGKWMFIPTKNGINRYWSIPMSQYDCWARCGCSPFVGPTAWWNPCCKLVGRSAAVDNSWAQMWPYWRGQVVVYPHSFPIIPRWYASLFFKQMCAGTSCNWQLQHKISRPGSVMRTLRNSSLRWSEINTKPFKKTNKYPQQKLVETGKKNMSQ